MDLIVLNGEKVDVVGTKLDLLAACTTLNQKDLETIINLLKYREKINKIDLSYNYFGKHRWNAIAKIIASRSSVTSLDLSHNDLELKEHWTSLSDALCVLNHLTELDISSNSIDSQGMFALVRALQNNNSLKKLSMKYFQFNEEVIDGLAQLTRYNQNITHLDLFGGSLNGTLSILPLIQALAKNRTVTYLDLGCLKMISTEDNRAELYEFIGSISSLQTLKLESNAINDHEIEALVYSLLRSRADIATLDLSDNYIQMKKTRSLTTLIEECPSLTDLNISYNKIDQQRLAILETSISRSRSIKRLNVRIMRAGPLSYNDSFTLFKDNMSLTDLDVTGYGFEYVPEAITNKFIGLKNIKKLNLESCLLKEKTEQVVEALIDMPIEELNLEYNFMNYQGVKAIPKLIQRTRTLRKLNLARNLLYHEFSPILEALSVNNTITELDISYNFLKSDGSKTLQRALAANTTMQILRAVSAKFDIMSVKELIETNRSLTKLDLKFNEHQHSDYTLILEALRSNVTLTDIQWMYGYLNVNRGQTVARVFPSTMNEGEKILFENKRRKLYASAVLIVAQTILWPYDQGLFTTVPPEVLEQILCYCSCQYFTRKQIGIICAIAANRSLPIDCHTLCRALKGIK